MKYPQLSGACSFTQTLDVHHNLFWRLQIRLFIDQKNIKLAEHWYTEWCWAEIFGTLDPMAVS